MTTATATRRLKALGHPVEMVRGNGYHYFVYDDGTRFESHSEYIPRFRSQTVEQWVARGAAFSAAVRDGSFGPNWFSRNDGYPPPFNEEGKEMTTITPVDIRACKAEHARIWEAVEAVALGVLRIRGFSTALGRGWQERSTHFSNYEVEGENGQEAIVARFYDMRDSDEASIRFPISYFESDYRAIEQAARADAEADEHDEFERRARLQV